MSFMAVCHCFCLPFPWRQVAPVYFQLPPLVQCSSRLSLFPLCSLGLSTKLGKLTTVSFLNPHYLVKYCWISLKQTKKPPAVTVFYSPLSSYMLCSQFALLFLPKVICELCTWKSMMTNWVIPACASLLNESKSLTLREREKKKKEPSHGSEKSYCTYARCAKVNMPPSSEEC